MKKAKFIKLLLISAAGAALIAACSSMISPSKTSLVTITVGSGKTASINIQRATMLAKAVNYLRSKVHVPEAAALVPSNIVSINVSATANDMPTISGTINVAGLTSVDIIVEVPNGLNRRFVVTGFDNSSNIAFWGDVFADLSGAPVTLPVPMINLGSVTNILYVSTGGNDTTGDGTEQNPYRTISQALSVSTNTPEAIFVGPGTFDENGGETFPLQLNPGTALVCRGPNRSTVLDDSTTPSPVPLGEAMISGDQAAYIDGCAIKMSLDWTAAVDDGGLTLRVNNALVDGLGTPICSPGILLSAADSVVMNSTLTGFPGCDGLGYGITINAGSPLISNNILSQNYSGIYINDGSPMITRNVIKNNSQYGIETSGLATLAPTISNNKIRGNSTGIAVNYGGTWNIAGNQITGNSYAGIDVYSGSTSIGGSITGNTITDNPYGINMNSAASTITFPSVNNNTLSCNTTADLNASVLMTIDATGNAWDHLPPQAFPSAAFACPAGADVCYFSALPDTTTSATLVASPCP